MAAITSYGGVFSTEAPNYYRVNGDSSGVDIKLEFKPTELVVCPKVALTQTANSVREGTPEALRPEIADRSNTAAEGDEGRHIDRMAGRTNPLYGANNPAAGATGLGSSATASNAHFGHRTKKPDGTFDVDPAWLTDGPSLDWHPNETGRQTFETTALCIEGDMAGTYLGSVSWGYDRDATGTINMRPLALVSMGVPSGQWKTSAEKWNSAQTDVGGTATDNMALPTPDHQTADPATLNDRELEQRMRELHARLHSMAERDDPDTYRNIQFEIRGLGREAVRRAGTVQDSGHQLTVAAGMTLWGLAEKHLKSGQKWVEIFALNCIELQNGDRLPAGISLKMPKPYNPGP